MYKGRYVAVIEYDWTFDNNAPNARPVEQVREMFRSGDFETELCKILCDEVFDARMGNCKVTQTLFDMYEQPEPPKEDTTC